MQVFSRVELPKPNITPIGGKYLPEKRGVQLVCLDLHAYSKTDCLKFYAASILTLNVGSELFFNCIYVSHSMYISFPTLIWNTHLSVSQRLLIRTLQGVRIQTLSDPFRIETLQGAETLPLAFDSSKMVADITTILIYASWYHIPIYQISHHINLYILMKGNVRGPGRPAKNDARVT